MQAGCGALSSAGADIRFNTELISFEQHPDHVQAAPLSGSRADEYGLLSLKKMNMTGMITNTIRIKLAEGMGYH